MSNEHERFYKTVPIVGTIPENSSGGGGAGLQTVVIRKGMAACTDRIGGAGVVTHGVVGVATQSDALLYAEGVKLYWYRQGKDDGVEHERAKIVAWLRDGFVRDWGQLWRNQLTNAIEAGEHLK